MRDVESFSGTKTQRYDGPILFAVRHGESAGNAENRFRGFTDYPLDHKGLEQAHYVNERLKKVQFGFAFSSDLRRAAETLDIIIDGRDCEIQRLAAMRPWNIGDFAGMPKINENRSKLQAYADHPHIPVPNGEALGWFRARYGAFWTDVISLALHSKGPGLLAQHASNNHEIGNIIYRDIDAVDVEPGGIIAIYMTTEGLHAKALTQVATKALDYS
jgi:broad specificity phosphatase PhoE